jgi:transposase InsO family protein
MTRDVELYVNACTTCGQVKQPRSYSKAKRKHVIAHKFNDIIQIDHIELEKLGLSAGGKKYILSITDVWSGFVVAVSTNSQKAEENISLIMHNWVLKHGVPRNIVSDGAPGFKAKFYKSVLSSLNCHLDYGLPYECGSTAKAERTNKRLNQSLLLILKG